MIIIKQLSVSKPFKYLWLKRVTGVNLSEHCARCLKGEYIGAVNNKVIGLNDLTLQNGIYYLCGVALPFVWANNFHLAFEYSQGDVIDYSNNGIHIIIENAVVLPISETHIDETNIKAKYKAYNTCRNWQFANYLNKRLL